MVTVSPPKADVAPKPGNAATNPAPPRVLINWRRLQDCLGGNMRGRIPPMLSRWVRRLNGKRGVCLIPKAAKESPALPKRTRRMELDVRLRLGSAAIPSPLWMRPGNSQPVPAHQSPNACLTFRMAFGAGVFIKSRHGGDTDRRLNHRTQGQAARSDHRA